MVKDAPKYIYGELHLVEVNGILEQYITLQSGQVIKTDILNR